MKEKRDSILSGDFLIVLWAYPKSILFYIVLECGEHRNISLFLFVPASKCINFHIIFCIFGFGCFFFGLSSPFI